MIPESVLFQSRHGVRYFMRRALEHSQLFDELEYARQIFLFSWSYVY
jgi:hypothetical protein